MPSFDDRSANYRHCCCHIRVAAYVLGILQLISVLFILAQHSIHSMITDAQQSDRKRVDDEDSSTNAPSDTGTRRWLGAGATTPLVTWAIFETLFLGLGLYGIVRSKPFLMIPQLFTQVITVIICMILNILMVCVLAWHRNAKEVWLFLASTLIFSFLYQYGLVVFIRCYRYLRDKETHAQRSIRGIFVLPSGANGLQSNETITECRMYSDLPPEYATAITMMTVDEANKANTSALPNGNQKTELASVSAAPCENEETQQQEPKERTEPEDSTPPPSYEEARQLQNVRASASENNESINLKPV